MFIEVTADDIRCGEPGAKKCPIALAARRQGVPVEFVRDSYLELLDGRQVYLPFAAKVFVRMFDAEERVSPFSFEVPI